MAAFRERLGLAGLDARSLAGRRVAAIGPETAEALRRGGIEADLVPAEYRAEGLVDALEPASGRGDAVLLVRAAEARDVLPRELEARGSRVAVVPAYRTAFAGEGAGRGPPAPRGPADRRRDVHQLVHGPGLRRAPGAGRRAPASRRRGRRRHWTRSRRTTAAAHGLHVAVMPNEYTVPALADAVAGYFETTPPAALRG